MAVVRPPARRDATSAPSSRALRSGRGARGARPNHVLTPRDHDILRWIGRYGVVSTEQVARRWFPRKETTRGPWTTSSAYRRVHDLEESGLLQRDQIYLRGPHILRLTLKGARIAGTDVRPARLVPATVGHALAVVDLIEELLIRFPGALLTTEREIRSEQIKARRTKSQTTPILKRIPDAKLRLPTGEMMAVELDHTPKTNNDIKRIAAAYHQHVLSVFDGVLWYARPGRIAARVRKTVLAAGFKGFITVDEWPVATSGGEDE